jgi:hypothetical protein
MVVPLWFPEGMDGFTGENRSGLLRAAVVSIGADRAAFYFEEMGR